MYQLSVRSVLIEIKFRWMGVRGRQETKLAYTYTINVWVYKIIRLKIFDHFLIKIELSVK